MKEYTEKEAMAVMKLSLKERTKICYVDNFCDEETYKKLCERYGETTLLRMIWEQWPGYYYMYFNDKLVEGSRDYERCYAAYMSLIQL